MWLGASSQAPAYIYATATALHGVVSEFHPICLAFAFGGKGSLILGTHRADTVSVVAVAAVVRAMVVAVEATAAGVVGATRVE